MTTLKKITPRVAIIGGGPAGLSAAKILGAHLGSEVLVIDREAHAGGIPRHADHPGYGIRDRKRFMSGPKYAKVLRQEALDAGVKIMERTQITGWEDERTLQATSPQGRFLIEPEAIILATGARERPRPARMIPGDRPQGVYTTGQLQNAVHIHHQDVGNKAVVVGAELVSWSATLTLKEAGCDTVALISRYPNPEAYALFNTPGKIFFRTQVITNSHVVRVNGDGRVESVEIEDLETGQRKLIECDTVVFTGDWIPDYELVRMAGIEQDPASGAPIVDAAMRTSKPGVFAAGNLNHPVETADVVAIEGEFVAHRVLEYLDGTRRGLTVPVEAEAPMRWMVPGLLNPGEIKPARNRLLTWVDEFISTPTVIAYQDGKEIGRTKVVWNAAPGRIFRIPADIVDKVNSRGGPVRIAISE